MAIEGKALCRGRSVGGRPCRVKGQRRKFAFGLRSIAVARLRRTRSGWGCLWGRAAPAPQRRERTRGSRTWDGVDTTVKPDLVCATIPQQPFRNRCAGMSRPSADLAKSPSDSGPGACQRGDGTPRGSVNTTVSAGSPSDSATPDGVLIITDRLARLARCQDPVSQMQRCLSATERAQPDQTA
jgi:hypothetical protein